MPARIRSRGSASSSRFRDRATRRGSADRCRITTSKMSNSRTRIYDIHVASRQHLRRTTCRRSAPQRGPAPLPQASRADHGRMRPGRRARTTKVAARQARTPRRPGTSSSVTSPPSARTSGGSRTSPSSAGPAGSRSFLGDPEAHPPLADSFCSRFWTFCSRRVTAFSRVSTSFSRAATLVSSALSFCSRTKTFCSRALVICSSA